MDKEVLWLGLQVNRLATMALCSVQGCDKEASAKGLCTKHYQAKRRGRLGKERQRAEKGTVGPVLFVRLTDELQEGIAEKAKAEGVSTAMWVRHALQAQVLKKKGR